MERLSGPWVHSHSPRILVGSFRPAGCSELVRKKELGEAFVEDSLQCSAAIFSCDTPAPYPGNAWSHKSLCLALVWAALRPCSCQAGTLLMGALTLPQALNFPSEPQACLFTWALLLPAVVSLCLPGWSGALVQQWSCAAAENDGLFLHCCRRIESAGIIEDDIPGSLGFQTQSLPAREQLLPKMMNTRHGIHQQQDSERVGEQSLCCS